MAKKVNKSVPPAGPVSAGPLGLEPKVIDCEYNREHFPHLIEGPEVEMQVTVTPAWGRDYRTAEAAAADWIAGKDFVQRDPTSRWDGKPCSVRDFGSGWTVRIRYGTVLNTGFALPNVVFVKGGKITGRVDPDNL